MDKNTNRPRTINSIYLRLERNIQGGHELMDLQTGRVIVSSRVTEIPVTDMVIKYVEQMDEDKGITSLKSYNRKRKIFSMMMIWQEWMIEILKTFMLVKLKIIVMMKQMIS